MPSTHRYSYEVGSCLGEFGVAIINVYFRRSLQKKIELWLWTLPFRMGHKACRSPETDYNLPFACYPYQPSTPVP